MLVRIQADSGWINYPLFALGMLANGMLNLVPIVIPLHQAEGQIVYSPYKSGISLSSVPLSTFSLASNGMQQNPAGELLLLSHHKSGTQQIQFIQEWICDKPYHKIEPRCENVTLEMHGVRGSDTASRYSAALHFIRNPLDLLLSGYLYHRACQEERWTDTIKRKHQWHLPSTLPVNGSYCKFLRHNSVEDGLEMELQRQLQGQDGLGIMLYNIELLKLTSANVLNVCLPDADDKRTAIEKFLLPWSRTSKTLTVPDVKSHHTNHSVQKLYYALAYERISRIVPATLLDSFPCRSVVLLDQIDPLADVSASQSLQPTPEKISGGQSHDFIDIGGKIFFEDYQDETLEALAFFGSLDYSNDLGGPVF